MNNIVDDYVRAIEARKENLRKFASRQVKEKQEERKKHILYLLNSTEKELIQDELEYLEDRIKEHLKGKKGSSGEDLGRNKLDAFWLGSLKREIADIKRTGLTEDIMEKRRLESLSKEELEAEISGKKYEKEDKQFEEGVFDYNLTHSVGEDSSAEALVRNTEDPEAVIGLVVENIRRTNENDKEKVKTIKRSIRQALMGMKYGGGKIAGYYWGVAGAPVTGLGLEAILQNTQLATNGNAFLASLGVGSILAMYIAAEYVINRGKATKLYESISVEYPKVIEALKQTGLYDKIIADVQEEEKEKQVGGPTL